VRIVYVGETFYPFVKGGAERRFYEIGRRFAAAGHEVHWYASRGRDAPETTRSLEGMTLRGVCPPLDLYHREGRRAITSALRLSLAAARALWRDREVVRKADVIDCSLYPFFHILLARLLFRRKPIVITWHEYWGEHWHEYLGWRGAIGKLVERLTARAGTHLVPVSELARDGLSSFGADPRRMTIIRNGVDTGAIQAISPAGDDVDLIYFGRLKNHKNVDQTLRAVALLRARWPGISLLVIGSGPEETKLKDLARTLGIERNVTFTGSIDRYEEVIARVKRAKLFVHPSTKEGGGSITLLEANACGLPAIVVRHPMGVDPSLVQDGRNGFWAEDLSPPAIAAVIERCLDDVGLLGSMRFASVAFAAESDWSEIAKATAKVYERFAPPAPKPAATAIPASIDSVISG